MTMQTSDQQFTDQLLSAYLDGELSSEQLAQIEQALATQPELAQRLQQLARVSNTVKQTYTSIDQHPMPQTITDMLKPVPEPSSNSALAEWWQNFTQSLRPVMPAAGMAAALVVGLLIGNQFDFVDGPQTPAIDNNLTSSIIQPGSELFDLLENTPSAMTRQLADNTRATPVLTFKSRSGQYCREFRTSDTSSGIHAVACREAEAWRMQVVNYHANRGASEDYYLTASATDSPVINDFVRQHMQGDAIGADDEQLIITGNWAE